MSGKDMQHAPANCENCNTPLQGQYCHACGQSVHNPTRDFSHALEEVFESFWHLDGRVFRTLRDLMAPGRIARNYLAGQRARYIPPLRLFVILSLVTFFVGKLVVHVEQAPIRLSGEQGAEIAAAQTVDEVRRVQDRLLAELRKDEAEAPGMNPGLIAARAAIEGAAADRIVALRRAQAGGATQPPAAQAPSHTATASAINAPAPPAAGAPGTASADKHARDDQFRFNDRPWDAKTNPVDVGILPAFADRWLNTRIGRARDNLEQWSKEPDRFVRAMLGAVSTALFLLMPVFALLLKVAYLGSGRRYLEHLVVALYSHAWLLLVLLTMFLITAMNNAFSAAWLPVVTGLVGIALWIWLPVYLWLTQHRVYGDRVLVTTLRYLAIGTIYLILVVLVIVFAGLAGLSS